MNICTFNIRGGKTSIKRKRMGQILSKARAGLCFLQETKLKKMEEGLANMIWGSMDYEWFVMD